MSKGIKIRKMVLGEGMPKVCIPITGKNLTEIISIIGMAKIVEADLVEWRVDFFEHVEDIAEVCKVLDHVRTCLEDMPLLFTFRRKVEGGQYEMADEKYIRLIKEVATTGMADMIDVEHSIGEDLVKDIIEHCHNYNTPVVASHHNFERTPDKQEIVDKLKRMRTLGADIPKIAVMPRNMEDVLTLLTATNEVVAEADCPIITISMGKFGAISRISGEFFGSALTFAAASRTSAPGQMAVVDVKKILHVLHQLV